MDLDRILRVARAAGLRGDRLPNFGDRFPPGFLFRLNETYNAARNEHAARRGHRQ